MKKIIVLMLCIYILLFSACTPAPITYTKLPEVPGEEPTQTLSGEQTGIAAPSVSSAATEPGASAVTEPDESPAESTAPTGPRMYSSYAHLVLYDPARGFADFDYFDMLKGNEAVEFLVETGSALADAQELVDNFADSEFVEKNTNPQLRAIDLRETQLKLMFNPDGTKVEGAVPADATLEDFYNLYHLNPSLITDEYFYYITVTDGEVVCVEQVYWP